MTTPDNDDTVRKIFVGGLDYETQDYSVRGYFESWGPLVESVIKRFPDGRSRGFAFVTFCSLAALDQCLATPEHVIDGKKVDIRRAETGSVETQESLEAKKYDPEAEQLRELHVEGLDITCDDEEVVRDYFTQYGDIDNVAIVKKEDSKETRAVITFAAAASVDNVQENRPHNIGDVKIETKRATPKHLVGKAEASIATNKAFIGPPEVRGRGHSGLSEDITDADLRQYFGQFGTVLSVEQLVWSDSGKKRGYG